MRSKTKSVRRFVSLITALVLCVTTIPIVGFAETQESQATIYIEKRHISMNYSKGVIITPKYIVIHETDNTRAGANADAHFTYWDTNKDAKSSAHFVVDSTKIIQLLELNEKAWHVGDNSGYSDITNNNAIGIEICVNSDGDYTKARQSCIELVKYLLSVTGLSADRVVRHNDASGKYCPRKMLDNPQLWIDFKNAISPPPEAEIYGTTSQITIDGKANEADWDINKEMGVKSGNNSANFGTLWDSNNLYLFFNVVDANVVNTGAQYPWQYDSIELYIDGDLNKGAYNHHTAQLVFCWGDSEVYLPNNSTHVNKSGIKYKSLKTPDGYAMEIAIPWSSIGGLTVEKGKKIGLNVHINNAETTDVLYYVPPTLGGDWANSAQWGEMTLTQPKTGSATLESIAITTQPTKKVYKVGEALDIMDMVVTGTYSDKTTKVEPITTANITGFDSTSAVGKQIITVTVGDKSATFSVTIENNDQAAPTGLTGVAPTSSTDSDGKIMGTTATMEYKLSTATTYIPVTGTQITGLSAGTYNVRYAAKPGYKAGAVTDVVVPAYATTSLKSITITTLPSKKIYTVGEALDLTGLVLTGTYSDGTSKVEKVTAENISGFDNTKPVDSLTLTITIDGKSTTYTVAVVAEKYTATIQASQGGQIIAGASGNYHVGQEIHIAASPENGYVFYGWKSTGGGAFKQSNNISTTFTMPSANVVITACFTPKSSGGGGSGSSGGSVAPKEPVNPQVTPAKPETEKQQSKKFDDLSHYDWAKDSINSLADMGIINGTSESTFSPGVNITRADFAILLVRALKFTSDSTENFSDVRGDAYYANELAIAKGCGIINGVGDNRFNPTAQISREDMIVIVARALEKAGYQFNSASNSLLEQFNDVDEISEYAKQAVALLVGNDIIKGSNKKINPKGNTTRAEIAVLLKRILGKKS